jgi:hypothetical protein
MNMDVTTIISIIVNVIGIILVIIGFVTKPSWLLKWFEKKYIEKCEKKRQQTISGIENENLIEFLRHYYGNKHFLKIHNSEGKKEILYPILKFETPGNHRADLVNVIKSIKASEENYLKGNSSYRNITEALNLFLVRNRERNQILYRMVTFTPPKSNELPQLTCSAGKWIDNWDMSEYLEWEIRYNAHKLKQKNEQAFIRFINKLPYRKKLHSSGNPIRTGKYRCAAIGVSTLIAFNDGKDPLKLLVRLRGSQGQPLRQQCKHVVPSFYFRPATDFEKDCSIQHNIFREYLQECFNYSVERLQTTHEAIYKYDEIKFLQQLISTGGAKLLLTGIAFNLFNLRPEICTLLLIEDIKWYKEQYNKIKYCKEFISSQEENVEMKKNDLFEYIPLTDNNVMINKYHLEPPTMVPAGAATFWLGVEVLRELGF